VSRPEDVATLLDALDSHTGLFGPDHARTLAVVHELALAMWSAGDSDGAAGLLEQVLDRTNSSLGANHPSSLAAKGDLAAVLFELGQAEEAGSLEREALESARIYLGKTHSVTCVLAWNRALNYERCGDSDSARKVFAEELAWLLAEDPSALETDQNTVRSMLAERFNWDAAKAC
jgi:tetratricopeptide (TPR) repeat protein